MNGVGSLFLGVFVGVWRLGASIDIFDGFIHNPVVVGLRVGGEWGCRVF